MIVAVDVHYGAQVAIAGGVLFNTWSDDTPVREVCVHVSEVEPYKPGSFYKRELPCLLKLLDKIEESIDIVVIDGYVWLGSDAKPGLGAHLYRALHQKVAVVGFAKNQFRDSNHAHLVTRGASIRPLFVTAVGMDPAIAATNVSQMHGRYRIPTLLKRVDRICRMVSQDVQDQGNSPSKKGKAESPDEMADDSYRLEDGGVNT